MNKKIFEHYMHTEPKTQDKKYLFIVDNDDLALSIIDAGFSSVAVLENREGFLSLDGLIDYLSEIALQGTCRMDYMFVPACSTKKQNDALAEYFRSEYLDYREGWKLFKDKDYLSKLNYRSEIQKLLHGFIDRYEKPPDTEPDLDRFHTLDKDGNPTSPLDIAIVEYLIDTISFFVLGATPYVYEHGVYHEDINGSLLKEEIRKLLYRKFMRSNTINRIYALLVSRPGVQKKFYELYNLPEQWVNFRNAYYDPIEEKLIEHDSKYLMINQIPFEFRPEQRDEILTGGKTIQSYLKISVPDITEQKMFWQYAGYCMTTDTQMQKFLMLTGNGGTGKSILIDLVQKMVGVENYSSIPLQDLNKRFYATGLFGKLLNACGDIPVKAMDATDVVKKAVGEDMILYEKKGEDAMHFFSHAKLLFSCNGVPENVEDKSDAFYRRLLILEMNHVITAEEKDTKLKNKVCKEIDFAIHMAMNALHELYITGQFAESENSMACVDKVRRTSDSVRAFVDETLFRQAGNRIEKSRMYEMYEDYCKENGRQPLGKSKFVTEMERKGFFVAKYQGIYKFKDVSVQESDFEPVDESEEIPFLTE